MDEVQGHKNTALPVAVAASGLAVYAGGSAGSGDVAIPSVVIAVFIEA